MERIVTFTGIGFIAGVLMSNAILQPRLRPEPTLDVSCTARGSPVIGRSHWYVRDHAVLHMDGLAAAFRCPDNTDRRL